MAENHKRNCQYSVQRMPEGGYLVRFIGANDKELAARGIISHVAATDSLEDALEFIRRSLTHPRSKETEATSHAPSSH